MVRRIAPGQWHLRCSTPNTQIIVLAIDERTLINTNCDLSKPEITVRFYLGDDGPVPGTNQMKTRMSEPFTFGFG